MSETNYKKVNQNSNIIYYKSQKIPNLKDRNKSLKVSFFENHSILY